MVVALRLLELVSASWVRPSSQPILFRKIPSPLIDLYVMVSVSGSHPAIYESVLTPIKTGQHLVSADFVASIYQIPTFCGVKMHDVARMRVKHTSAILESRIMFF